MRAPIIPGGARPAQAHLAMLRGPREGRDIGGCHRKFRRRRKISEGFFPRGEALHHFIRFHGRRREFQLPVKPREMEPDRLHGPPVRRIARMLHGVSVDAEPMDRQERRRRIFSGDDRPKRRPARGRGRHVSVRWTILMRKISAASGAKTGLRHGLARGLWLPG